MTSKGPVHHQHHSVFGDDLFGRLAERFARFFGTPQFIIGQTILVIIWICLNVALVAFRWDAYPFILLNLAFSTQAAYAAPLILLAATRQADRDKRNSVLEAQHRADIASSQHVEVEAVHLLLESNTEMTEQVHRLAREIHATLRYKSRPAPKRDRDGRFA